MKKMLLLSVLIFFSFYAAYAQNQIKNNNSQTLLIDVRTKYEYENGHLKNAINIPYTKVKHQIKKYAEWKEIKIIVYCQGGYRSEIAKKILKKKWL